MAKHSEKEKGKKQKQTSGKPIFPLRYPLVTLVILVLLVYSASIGFGYTKLDDTIFIQDYRTYNEDLGNLITSFRRGVFHETNDTYYRPLFLNSMIINNIFSGQNVAGYHLFNVLLHLGVVLLLFRFLIQTGIRELHALILTGIFAIHPVLTQNVVWIPGRNDTLLAVFVLLFLIKSISYAKAPKTKTLIYAFLWLLCAYFTKETAVFAPVSAFLIIVFILKIDWRARQNWIQYGMWVLAFGIWYAARSAASIIGSEANPGELAESFVSRMPLLVQYIGKIFLPFNLSVFPIMEDTVYYYGFAAIGILITIIVLSRKKDWRTILAGLLIFLSFLIPVFLVPAAINTQTFEHRLYLPMIGMLIVLSQTVMFKNRFSEKQLLIGGAVLIAGLSLINILHQRHFKNELSFWTQAVETSPNSAYAIMMLGAKLPDPAEGAKLFRKAYAIDSTEKYINYYYGAMLQYQDSILESERYLLAEKQRSDYVECDYMLARVAVQKNNIPEAIEYLENFLARAPLHELGNTNLLQLYLQSGDLVKARLQMMSMDQKGMPVSPDIRKALGE